MKKVRSQEGASLLVLLLFLLLGTGAFFLDFLAEKKLEKQKQLRTQNALDTAKKALIAYAVSDTTRPGELPCPDIDNDGKIDGVGGNCSDLRGWLPWFRLGLGDIRDGDGERLWYAISSSFRPYGAVPPGVPLNPDTQTNIVINNIDPADNPGIPYVAAVIIAPGRPLSVNEAGRTDQELSGATADDVVASYLEDRNSGADKTAYTRQPATGDFNDAVAIITVDEIMQNVGSRVKQQVINEIRRYRADNGFYPFAEPSPGSQCNASLQTEGYLQYKTAGSPPCVYATVLSMPAWFEANNWHRMFWYAFDSSCQTDAGGPAVACEGGLTVDADNDVESLIVYSGKALHSVNNSCGSGYSQVLNRPSVQPCDYFDNAANYDFDGIFESPVDSAISNDELIIIN
jgi:hypothetical protein